MAGKSDQMKGKAKEAVGDLTGNKDLKSEGKADRQAGEVNVSPASDVELSGLHTVQPKKVGNYVHRSWNTRRGPGSRCDHLFRPSGVGWCLGRRQLGCQPRTRRSL